MKTCSNTCMSKRIQKTVSLEMPVYCFLSCTASHSSSPGKRCIQTSHTEWGTSPLSGNDWSCTHIPVAGHPDPPVDQMCSSRRSPSGSRCSPTINKPILSNQKDESISFPFL